ncbi:MAG: SLC13 family permease, partial [Bacteroidetes bacterium]|nr:SLC13 family permease [Bacteroidota bacterium]
MLVVFAIILVGLVLFVTEVIPIDLTAIGLMVAVILLEPWTEVGVEGGLSGFASTATITVLAMFILSEGIRRTGLLQLIGDRIITLTQGKPKRQLAALVGLSGGTAGFINNTPVVAMMIPMVVNIAKKTNTSPSKYLIPVSFASMIGGMLTLIGTSTNLLASDVSARLLDQPFSMFEFTHLGALLLVVGAAYLLLIGWRLTPARIEPEDDPMETFEMAAYLTEVIVLQGSPLI